ncbi:hypothetical protein B0H14DRAFT_2626407 [Mycena olivaceomarginata]|nr:hypothetical protein B0H14DRAFT_2626407 [Mycena olivaceomarginata]
MWPSLSLLLSLPVGRHARPLLPPPLPPPPPRLPPPHLPPPRPSPPRPLPLSMAGTIYAVHNPQPIGEWFSAADNKNSVVGTLHVAPSDVPQRQAAAPRRAKGAKAPTTAASDARPNRKPKEAPSMSSGAPGPSLTLSAGTPNASNMSFGAPGPLLTSSAGPPNAAAPDITAAPAPTPIVTPAIVPAVPTPTPAPPPLDPAALVGLWAQLNQVFGGRDPAQVIAEMQGPPPQ